jgi:AraC-like DNA-binding protein
MRALNDTFDFILLSVGYIELNADWNWYSIYSPFARFYYVNSGEARIRVDGTTYRLLPGYLYLIPPFTLHDDECDGDFSLYYIHFYERAINKVSTFDEYNFPVELKATSLDFLLTQRILDINPGRQLIHIDPHEYDNQSTLIRYLNDNSKQSFHGLVETQGILYQLMSRFVEFRRKKTIDKDHRVVKSLRYIHENVDKDIAVPQLANIACITEDHFIRIFKKEMGCTPVKYINTKKIEKAQLLLLTTDMPVRDVALELSIDNVSYFNKIFKLHTGKTPGEYRSELKG